MIPKVIHYCWFGGKPMPDDAIRCIASWKKFCPDYEIIRWDENNYDVHKNQYMSDAYKEKKWAFVSDYARVDIIYSYGGIYFDTDVELIASIDSFLNDGLFCGWENRDPLLDQIGKSYDNSVAFGLGFGAEKAHPALKKMLDLYEEMSFYNPDGSLNLLACPAYQTKVLTEYGLDVSTRSYQKLNGISVYPEDFFSPKSILTGKIELTENSVSIHHFKRSWQDFETQKICAVREQLCSKMSYERAEKLTKFVTLPLRIKRKIRYLLKMI